MLHILFLYNICGRNTLVVNKKKKNKVLVKVYHYKIEKYAGCGEGRGDLNKIRLVLGDLSIPGLLLGTCKYILAQKCWPTGGCVGWSNGIGESSSRQVHKPRVQVRKPRQQVRKPRQQRHTLKFVYVILYKILGTFKIQEYCNHLKCVATFSWVYSTKTPQTFMYHEH